MATAATDTVPRDPREHTMLWWRSRLGALGSRGEVDGPRVEQCRRALEFHAFDRRLQQAILDGLIGREFAVSISHVAALAVVRMSEPVAAEEPRQGTPGPEEAVAVP
ncbi:MAG TPA: hypothetical protein VMU34_02730 [Mycobacterium sp.]|nr:hypothetical protein [Mycobacterium sp.]